MKRGRTPLTLSLLGLSFLILGSFFVPVFTPVAYANQNITAQQLDAWIADAIKNSTPPTGAFSKEVINEANTGKYKFPVPSYAQIGVVCGKVNSAEAGGSTLLGVQVTDATAKNACDTWQTDTGNLNHIIGNYYIKVLSLKTASAEQRSATRACVDPDNSFGGSGCIPTDAQIQKLIDTVNADKQALYAAAKLSNVQAAGASAAQLLKDSGCPDQAVVATGATTDTPSPDFVAQYKKDHPNDPAPTCQELRDNATQAALAQKNAEAAASPAGDSCGITNLTACLVSGMAWIISEIEWLILAVAAGILGLANYLLGWSTYVTVFQFGNLVGNSAGLLAAWGVMRDVANIVLLFGFIFLGVSTILNLPHSEYTAKKAIPALIVFALLLNFSLFAVEAVIDVSNALATSIYEQATGGQGVCEQDTGTIDCIFKQGIGGQVMAMSGMASMYGFGSGENEAQQGDNVKLVVVYAGLIIFAVITTLVLFAAAIMLIIRAVVLAFLMVTAPIGFAGMAIPPLHEMASRWWKELISQALFAPVYFLLALLSLKIMSGVMIALGTQSTGATRETLAGVFMSAGDGGARGSNITIVMTFALIIGFMVAALMFAKKSSAMGTSMAMSGAGKLAFGSLGFVGRNTVGRGLYSASRAVGNTNWGQTTRLGNFSRGLLKDGSKLSFDARAGTTGKLLTGAAGNLGDANKGGYEGAVHAREEKRKEQAKNIGNTDKEKARLIDITRANNASTKELEKIEADKKVEMERLEAEIKNEEANRQADLTTLQPQKDRLEADEAELASAEEEAKRFTERAERAEDSGNTGQAEAMRTKANAAKARADGLKSSISTQRADIATAEAQMSQIVDLLKVQKEAAEKKFNDSAKAVRDQIDARQKETGKLYDMAKQRKREFADNIHSPSMIGGNVGRVFSNAGNTGDHHAAEEILRESYQSEDQKILKAIKDAMARQDAPKSDDHGGGGNAGGDKGGNSHGPAH